MKTYQTTSSAASQKEAYNGPAKRINIVSVKLVKESSLLYKEREITSPKEASELIRRFIGEADREHFVVICLDSKNQPTCFNTCHIGSLNASIVHPREVMKTAILSNAASILLGHNHPSGNPNPSREDILVTQRLMEAGRIVGINVLDHIIIGNEDSFVSLKEKGHMKEEEEDV